MNAGKYFVACGVYKLHVVYKVRMQFIKYTCSLQSLNSGY